MFRIKLSYWVATGVVMIAGANPLLAKDKKSQEGREIKIIVMDDDQLLSKPIDPSLMQTQVYKLEHANCEEVARVVRSLFQNAKTISKANWFEPGNAVLMRGTAEEIEQMVSLIEQIDLPSLKKVAEDRAPQDYTIEVVPLAHADAKEMAEILGETLYSVTHHKGGRRRHRESKSTRIIVDTRLNTLILCGDDTQISIAKGLIEKLDIPTGPLSAKQAELKRKQ